MMITVEKIDESTFRVNVKERTTTTHKVTLKPAYHEKLAGGGVTP
jgi:hypothetical protein